MVVISMPNCHQGAATAIFSGEVAGAQRDEADFCGPDYVYPLLHMVQVGVVLLDGVALKHDYRQPGRGQTHSSTSRAVIGEIPAKSAKRPLAEQGRLLVGHRLASPDPVLFFLHQLDRCVDRLLAGDGTGQPYRSAAFDAERRPAARTRFVRSWTDDHRRSSSATAVVLNSATMIIYHGVALTG